jgi:hypothetical protein
MLVVKFELKGIKSKRKVHMLRELSSDVGYGVVVGHNVARVASVLAPTGKAETHRNHLVPNHGREMAKHLGGVDGPSR